MPLLPSVDEFLAAIESYQAGFRHTYFSYLAIKFAERYQIVRGRLYMAALPPVVLPPNFQSPHVRAGHYTLEGLDTDVRGLIAQLLAGGVETPDGPLEFPAAPGGHHSASFLPLHPDGLMSQTRVSVLTITGGETENIRQPEIDWEVKAASRPYDNLQELANEVPPPDRVQPRGGSSRPGRRRGP